MAQKFVSLDEAAQQLGISKDRLNELREDGKVRAYRDGASWKFRADDVDKLAADGIPSPDASGSDIALNLDDDEPSSAPVSDIKLDSLDLGSSLELDLGEEDPVASAATSDLNLDDLDEPTVPVDIAADGDDDSLSLGDVGEIDEFSDSILLSENELGESTDRPPSTIIGKAEMAADLDLAMGDDASASDVRLAGPSASNVFAPGGASEILDTEPPSLSDNFGDLDEIEIDLEAESSRILAPEDLTAAQQAGKAKAAPKEPEFSDLELAASDSNLGNALDSSIGKSDIALAGLSAFELEGDDDVLGDGSDITLSSESSGINIISPSDSGLALDEVPLAMGSGSPLASGLDLGGDAEVGLEPLEVAEDDGAEPFALTPFGEEASEDEEDSSQVIPLDEVSEEEGGLLGTARVPAVDTMGDDFAAIASTGGMMPVGEPVAETAFPGWVIGLMSVSMIMLVMCGMMVFDLLRNIWSWDQVYTLNSSLMDVLTPILG
jgi:excisionase family DNA binding protein